MNEDTDLLTAVLRELENNAPLDAVGRAHHRILTWTYNQIKRPALGFTQSPAYRHNMALAEALSDQQNPMNPVLVAIAASQEALARGERASVTFDPDSFDEPDEMDRDAIAAFFEEED